MIRRRFGIMLAPGVLLTLLVAMGLAGCGASGTGGGGLYGSSNSSSNGSSSGSTGASSGQTACASSAAPVCTRSVQINGTAKQALVTPDGKTLYYFTSDSATTSACTAQNHCTSDWTPLLSSSGTVAPISGLSGTVATLSRSEGTQIVYNGHPLYTFVGDKAAGDTKGEGIEGKWFVAAPDLAPAGGSNNSGYDYGY